MQPRNPHNPRSVVGSDFLFGEYKDEFLDNSRCLISEAYCRIQWKVDISDLSERLPLSRNEGEKWIVNLTQETRMGADAKNLERMSLKSTVRLNTPINLSSKKHVGSPSARRQSELPFLVLEDR